MLGTVLSYGGVIYSAEMHVQSDPELRGGYVAEKHGVS